jgi:transposase
VEKRRLWKELQKQWPADQLVFLDESCAKTNMTRLRGRALQGRRLHDHAPGGQWHTTTMLGSIRLDGETACMVIEGAANSAIFREYVRRVLAPTLRPGDIVICDNLGAHRDREASQIIEDRGASLLFLPAYSPDLNPIEAMWSKVKASLRQTKARTQKQLLLAIRKALASISASDAQGFFRHAGYVCTIN